MKKIIIVLLGLFLIGCSRGMTNGQIIEETKKCEKAGLKATILVNMLGDVWVRCLPKSLK